MIITTKRPASILVMDTLITAAAWLAFIYQFTQGVLFLLSDHPAGPLSPFFGITLSPTTTTLLTCLIVCGINALLVYAWACLQRTGQRNAYAHRASYDLTTETLADHFSLSPQQLDDVQDSRVTVVYHSPAGGITHLEVGDLQLQNVGQPFSGTALHVA